MKRIYIILSAITATLLLLPVAIVAAAPSKNNVQSMTLIDSVSTSTGSPPPLCNLSYNLLGLKLNSTLTYYVSSNGTGNDRSAVVDQTQLSFAAWNATTDLGLFNYGGTTFSGYARDGRSTVSWAPLSSSTVVSKTVIWYTPDSNGDGFGEIVEADIILNKNLKWGIDADGEGETTIDRWDIRNAVTHCAGHVAGLADMCDESCRQLTMHGDSVKGETCKISLEGGDVTGAQYMYGARTTR